MDVRGILLCGLLWHTALLALPRVVAAQEGPVTLISLRPAAMVRRAEIRLGDVADIIDDNVTRRNQFAGINLAKFDFEHDLTIEQSFVSIRLRLAGHRPESFTLGGATQTIISAPPQVTLTDLGVEQAVYDSLSRLFQVPQDELVVKLVNPFIGSWMPDPKTLNMPRVELVPPTQLPLGTTQLTLRILDGERIVAGRAATFDISRRQRVLVAVSTLDRSTLVTADFVREEIRFIDKPIDQLTIAQVTGRSVIQPLRPGEIVTLKHVSAGIVEESPLLVKTRDSVRLTAKKGALIVSIPQAEALQDGRLGQLVKVRNLQTGREVSAKVVGKGELELLLD